MKTPWLCPTEYPHRLIAVDMHTHINYGSPYDTKVYDGYSANLEDLILINRAAGIEKMFACTFASCLSTEAITEGNAYMHGLLDRVDCLYQWVV